MLTLAIVVAAALETADRSLYDSLCREVAAACDTAGPVHRGVPNESAIDLAFALAHEEQDAGPWKARALAGVRWLATLEDSVAGGFFDAMDPRDPPTSLDKRMETNGRRLVNQVDAWMLTGDRRYRDSGARVLGFVERVLMDGRGGFWAEPAGEQDLVPAANGHAIRAWLWWAAANRDVRRRDFALASLDRIWGVCWRDSLGFVRVDAFGDMLAWPLLADQVEMGRAYLLASHLVGRGLDLERARKIGDQMLRRFESAERAGFQTRAMVRKDGRTRKAPRLAGENARAALFLAELGQVTKEPRYREAARRAWQALAQSKRGNGLEAAEWALALRATVQPDWLERPVWPERRPAERRQRAEAGALGQGDR